MDYCCCCAQKKPACKPRKPNYQKTVDPYVQKYVNFLDKRKTDAKLPCSLCAVDRSGKKFVIPFPCDKFMPKVSWTNKPCCPKRQANPTGTEYSLCARDVKQPCSPGKEKCSKCPDEAKKLVICMPDGDNSRDIPLGNVRVFLPPDKPPKPCFEPKDYAYRCESRELLGSKLFTYCLCVRRNGLQHECPRTPCQGRDACLVKPWPDCWPSGGCHGQDYDRPNGVERVNPTLQYRRDNPKCGPCYRPSPDARLIVEQC